jgi:hypothetical protein
MEYAYTERGTKLIQQAIKETRSDYDETSICDRCTQDVHCDDIDTPDSGDWEGASLCPDCMAEVGYDWED